MRMQQFKGVAERFNYRQAPYQYHTMDIYKTAASSRSSISQTLLLLSLAILYVTKCARYKHTKVCKALLTVA